MNALDPAALARLVADLEAGTHRALAEALGAHLTPPAGTIYLDASGRICTGPAGSQRPACGCRIVCVHRSVP